MTTSSRPTPAPWNPFAVVPAANVAIWVMLSCAVLAKLGAATLSSMRPDPQDPSDFFQEWASARNYFEGLPIYADHHITIPRYLGCEIGPGESLMIAANAHPPTSVLLALPFAKLDYVTATFVWNLVSLAALALALTLIVREWKLPFRPWMVVPITAMLILSFPMRHQVAQGQLNLLLLLILTGVWVSYCSGRLYWAGSLLALATAIKLVPGFLFLYFLVRREWTVVAVGVVAWIAMTLATVAILGSDSYVDYVRDVVPYVDRTFRTAWNNASLSGFWHKLFNAPRDRDWMKTIPLADLPLVANAAWLGMSGVLTAGWAWYSWKARGAIENDCAYAMGLVLMLLVSPASWEHTFLLLLIPLALVWMYLPKQGGMLIAFVAVLAALNVDLVAVYRTFIPGGFPNGTAGPLHTLTVLSFQCYALLGLLAMVALTPRQVSDRADPAPG